METLRTAADALRAHKLRSFLTLLGIIIGVMTIVSVVSIISGLNRYVSDTFGAILTPEVFVIERFGIITSREEFLEAIKRPQITLDDYEAVQRNCPSCASVAASSRAFLTVKRGKQRAERVAIRGVTANMPEVRPIELEAGRLFTQGEDHHAAPVAIIGADVREKLFGRLDPVNRTVTILGQRLKIIGVLEKRGAIFGESQDTLVYVPHSTLRRAFGIRNGINIAVRARSVGQIEQALDEVRVVLRSRRHTGFRDKDPFGVITAEEIQRVWKTITAGAFALMIFISGISLIVGGIVIMNIMLVSVVERTREIGVRRAMGATRGAVLRQFLTEAVLLALIGGAVGTILGWGISKIIAVASPLPTAVPVSLVVTSLGIALLTGIIAGIVPARKAAALAPVEALRWE